MRVLVCGGRNYAHQDQVWAMLDELHVKTPIERVIEGGASGADLAASNWAVEREVPRSTYWADWRGLGPAAGPVRNQRMMDEGKPDMVIAFPGGRGTADMVRRAKAAGIKVLEVKAAPSPAQEVENG